VIYVFFESPYVSILKLKGSIVDLSVAAATCSILGAWDYRVIIVAAASVMIHSGCDVLNDIYDLEIDKICKPDGAVASGQIPLRNAWAYMMLLFSASLAILLVLGPIAFLSALVGIMIGGVLYSHPRFRLKDKPGIAMAAMALCFTIESVGIWSLYAPVDASALTVAAYVFVLIFSLTFMKDFKDVAGDVCSLPLLLGPHRAAKVCCALTLLPLLPLSFMAIRHNTMLLAAIVYIALAAVCIKILLGDPVKNGARLKNWMILALTLPNFIMLL
jgi:4-hydroxybenzoate polyprenyltransferase